MNNSGLVLSDKLNIKKLILLWGQLVFYSILIYLFFCLIGIESFSFGKLMMAAFPIITEEWWFASTYIVLLVFIPFLNVLLKSLRKKQFQAMLLTMGGCWCIIPSSFLLNFYITQNELNCNALLWFIFIYCIGSYLQLFFEDNRQIKSRVYLIIAVSTVLLTFSTTVVFDLLGRNRGEYASYATFYYGMKKFPMVLIPIMLFLWGKSHSIRTNKVINIVSSTTFGIYLLHDHPLMRSWLWNTVFHNSSFIYSKYLLLYSFFSIIIVFVTCSFIEFLRKSTIERLFLTIIECAEKKICILKRKKHKL